MRETEERLFRLLLLVNDQQRFAEAKNGALLAVSGASAFGLIASFNDITAVLPGWRESFIAASAIFCLSFIASLLSLLPKTDPAAILKSEHGNPSESDNLCFFGDLCRYTPKGLVKAINAKHGSTEVADDQSAGELDIAEQIIVNSTITSAKFRSFRTGGWLVVMAIVSIPVVHVCSLIIERLLR